MRLLDKRLLVVTGKGGVGKSAVASALALYSARSGKRTLVCEINSAQRLGGLYGKPVGPELTLVEENLWAVNVRPEEALREYALMVLKFKSVYRAVFENRLVRYFLRFIPSVGELVMLGKVLYHVKEMQGGGPRYEVVVMDAPATGHAVSFLQVPQVLLDTVATGPLWTEAKWMRDLLVDPKTTSAVLVSLPEEMPVNETLELEEALRKKVKIPTALVVLNGYTAPRFDERDLASLGGSALLPVGKNHFDRAQLSLDSRNRLERAVAAPVATVPRLYEQTQGMAMVERVSDALARALESAP
ncbi:MAG TPA: ArsA family ATPase [Myxococcaceae bacterium]|jgi:anion-transporting  ArsA/GET3 family ATPase